MIRLVDVSKTITAKRPPVAVLASASAEFRCGRSYGVLARSGAGKSTLIQMLCGGIDADRGEIERWCSVSFPLGYAGWLTNELTASDNIAFMARLYGANVDRTIDAVFDFCELRRSDDIRLRDAPPVTRVKICYGLSFVLEFEMVLIDESMGTGDARFRAKCFDRVLDMKTRGGIIATSSNPVVLSRLCDVGVVLHGGKLTFFNSVFSAKAYLDQVAEPQSEGA